MSVDVDVRPPGARWPFGRYALCIGLFLGGLSALVISTLMGVHFGQSIAATDDGRLLQAASSATIHLFVGLLALAAGALIGNKKGWLGSGVGLAAVAFGLYATTCIIGFGASERIGKTMIAEAQIKAQEEALRAARAETSDTKAKTVEWLQATFAGTRKGEVKADLLKTLATVATAPAEVKVAKVETVGADVQAMVFAKFATGASDKQTVEDVQMKMVTVSAFLLVLADILGFGLCSALWPRRELVKASAEVPEEKPLPAPEPAQEVGANTIPFPVPHRPEAVQRKLSRDEERAIVKAFFAEARAMANPLSKAKSEAVYAWFRDWSEANGHQLLTHTKFGTLAGELGADRVNDGRNVIYRGVACPVAVKIAA